MKTVTKELIFPSPGKDKFRFLCHGTHTFQVKVTTETVEFLFDQEIKTVTVEVVSEEIHIPEPLPEHRDLFLLLDCAFVIVRDDDEFWGEGGKQGFLQRTKQRNNLLGLALQQDGLFEWDEKNGRPKSPAKTFVKAELEANNKRLMAHIMVELGIFKSVSEARKNGWDKPIELGEFEVTKKKIKFIVV